MTVPDLTMIGRFLGIPLSSSSPSSSDSPSSAADGFSVGDGRASGFFARDTNCNRPLIFLARGFS
jgi:hypothetical protein